MSCQRERKKREMREKKQKTVPPTRFFRPGSDCDSRAKFANADPNCEIRVPESSVFTSAKHFTNAHALAFLLPVLMVSLDFGLCSPNKLIKVRIGLINVLMASFLFFLQLLPLFGETRFFQSFHSFFPGWKTLLICLPCFLLNGIQFHWQVWIGFLPSLTFKLRISSHSNE